MRRALALVVALAGCAPGLPHATERDAARSGRELARLSAGRTRYVDKCSGCHRPYPPARYVAAEWPQHVAEMRGEAKLQPADEVLILDYLATFARP